jgi:hypothetical protein
VQDGLDQPAYGKQRLQSAHHVQTALRRSSRVLVARRRWRQPLPHLLGGDEAPHLGGSGLRGCVTLLQRAGAQCDRQRRAEQRLSTAQSQRTGRTGSCGGGGGGSGGTRYLFCMLFFSSSASVASEARKPWELRNSPAHRAVSEVPGAVRRRGPMKARQRLVSAQPSAGPASARPSTMARPERSCSCSICSCEAGFFDAFLPAGLRAA